MRLGYETIALVNESGSTEWPPGFAVTLSLT